MKSIRTRLTIALIAPLAIVAMFFSLETYYSAKKISNELNDRTLLAASLTILEHVISSNGSLLADATLATLQETLGDQFFYYVRGPSGAFITGYSAYPTLPDSIEIVEDKPVFYDGMHRGIEVRAVQLKRDFTNRELNGITSIITWQHTTQRQSLVLSLFARSLVRLLLLTLVAGAIVWVAVKAGLRPLARLQQSIDNRSNTALNPIMQRVPKELQGMVNSMNSLLERVARSKKNRERFVGDAAHQLRNPIAAIKVQAQASLESGDQEAMRAGLDQILEVSDKSANMVNKMLAGVSAHALDAEHDTEFDLCYLIRNKASELAPLAFDKNQEVISAGIDSPLLFKGNEILLGEAVANLIHNAIQHNVEGSNIDIRLFINKEGHVIDLSIADDGVRITDEDFNALTQPFRTGGTSPGNSGLGLSIAKDIARMHQGSLETRPTPNGKAVVIRLPLDRAVLRGAN